MREKSKPVKIEELIQETLKEFGKKRNKYKNLLMEIQENWTALVGDLIASNTRVVRISKNKLIINTANSTWMHELIYHRVDLQNKIQKLLPDTEALSIVFKVGSIHKDGQSSSEDRGGNDLPSMESAFPQWSDEEHHAERLDISSASPIMQTTDLPTIDGADTSDIMNQIGQSFEGIEDEELKNLLKQLVDKVLIRKRGGST